MATRVTKRKSSRRRGSRRVLNANKAAANGDDDNLEFSAAVNPEDTNNRDHKSSIPDVPAPKQTQDKLVERINALPLTEFIEHYIPQRARDFTISLPCAASNAETGGMDAETYSLDIQSSSSISKPDLEACFSLIRLTSSDAYKRSSMGWSPAKKKREMKLLDMRYLLLVRGDANGQCASAGSSLDANKPGQSEDGNNNKREIGGFLSFMVTYEDDIEVLYCYEIHLAPALQNRGLGKLMLGFFEDTGCSIGLKKGMLTVYKANEAAIRFYQRLGYEEDEYSPRPMKLRNGNVRDFDYMILSKELKETRDV
ncbi:hypothetical protein AJ80_06072 [Polytolypa hystricis UAMH7299]|uniref:N-alpha-acetyltransferase 40 n=1 Tax=Polytolypa hystricis (strain UAMH7299) TaxID=1447883 RepID=A0A2B7XZT0_POLH7|nr:hypothetical protein AJ80_06072 [Polytolypa hystricis UAMH7299]